VYVGETCVLVSPFPKSQKYSIPLEVLIKVIVSGAHPEEVSSDISAITPVDKLTAILSVIVQKLSVIATKYVVSTDGNTVIEAVVSPLLHKYVIPPLAVSTVESPVHIVVSLLTLTTDAYTVIVSVYVKQRKLIVTTYSVVTVGWAQGLGIVSKSRPVEGDQE
jgi:hypothetical protein